MHHPATVGLLALVTLASEARADEPGDAPTTSAALGGLVGVVVGGLAGVVVAGVTFEVSESNTLLALAAGLATTAVGAGLGAGFARSAAGDHEHSWSAGLATAGGTAASASIGMLVGGGLGAAIDDGGALGVLNVVAGGGVGVVGGALLGAVVTPIVHGTVVAPGE